MHIQNGYAIRVVTILAVHSVYTECKGEKNRAQFLVCAHILIPIYNSEELYFGLTSTSDLKKTLYVRYAQVGLYLTVTLQCNKIDIRVLLS